MPYVKKEHREQVNVKGHKISDVGQLNYVITRYMLAGWKDSPRYSTIHRMYHDFVEEPQRCKALVMLYHSFCYETINRSDVNTAAALAFMEFYRRIGQVYETVKIAQNGDLPEYQEALEPLVVKLNELHKAKESEVKLLVPNSEVIR